MTLSSTAVCLFVGFRFYSCLLQALQKADSASSSQPCTFSADTEEGSVTTALKSDRTDIPSAAEQDCTSSPVDTLVASERAVNSIDTVNLCDLFK